MKPAKTLAVLGIALTLTACGTDRGDRAGSGALIGGATGAAVGAAVAGDPWAGAAIGGAVGAGAGALIGHETNSNDVNFGKPIWR